MTRDRRPLASLLGAIGMSELGTRMSFLAIPWFVLTTTRSPTTTGIMAFAEMGPYVLLHAAGGPLVDRLGARWTSVSTDVIAAVLLGTVPGLYALGVLPIALLGVLLAGVGAVRGVGDSSRSVLVPGVTELASTSLERSSGLYDGIARLAQLIGGPTAGALLVVIPATAILAVDAVTFFISALLVLSFLPIEAQPPPPPERSADGPPSYLSSLREGIQYLCTDRLLLGIAVMLFITNFVDQAGGAVLFPVWAKQIVHSSVALGLVGGVLALGAVTGNALTTWLGSRLPRRLTYAVGFLIAGAPRFLVTGLVATVSPVLAVVFLGGLGAGGINPILGAVEYERVPRHLQARVLGSVGALAWAGIPLGGVVAGAAVSGVGLRATFIAAGMLYGLTTLAPFVFPAWKQMNRPQSMERNKAHSLAALPLSNE